MEGREAPVTARSVKLAKYHVDDDDRGVCKTGGKEDGVFFFSSRRRHTRLQGDWSSDVCSSDLCDCGRHGAAGHHLRASRPRRTGKTAGAFTAAGCPVIPLPPKARQFYSMGSLRQERSEEHTSELQSPCNLVCRLLLEKKKKAT